MPNNNNISKNLYLEKIRSASSTDRDYSKQMYVSDIALMMETRKMSEASLWSYTFRASSFSRNANNGMQAHDVTQAVCRHLVASAGVRSRGQLIFGRVVHQQARRYFWSASVWQCSIFIHSFIHSFIRHKHCVMLTIDFQQYIFWTNWVHYNCCG